MVRARRAARRPTRPLPVATLPSLDARLLPKAPAKVMTVHELPREGEGGGPDIRKALDRMDGVVVLTEHGAQRLETELGVPPEKITVIPHGAFDYLTRLPDEVPLVPELEGAEGPVILSFGLIRPYKGVDVLLRAFAELEADTAELWIAGRPLGVDPAELRALADAAKGRVRFVTRFITDAELPAIFRRADIVALPYREAQQSGVLFAALAFGKAIVASSVGGLAEAARAGEGDTLRLVAPGTRPSSPRPCRHSWQIRPSARASAPPQRPRPPARTHGTPSPHRRSTSTAGRWTGECRESTIGRIAFSV